MNNEFSLLKSQFLHVKKLLQKKYRYQYQEFIIEGLHLIEEAQKHQEILKFIITSNKDFKINGKKKIPIYYTSYENICKLSTTKTPQPYIGVCKFLNNNINYDNNFILILDNINDPGNLGTIIRTAYSFGIQNIIAKGVDIYNPKILRATQGAIFNTNIINNVDIYEAIQNLKSTGYKIIGSLLKNAIDYNKLEIKDEKLSLVLGNESNEISESIIKLLDYKVYIPIKFESLNVAIACGILLSKYLK